MLVDVLGSGINILEVYSAPFQRGFRAGFELILIAGDHLRPVWQRQAEVDPGPANVQVQVAAKIETRDSKRAIETACVVVVPAPLFKPPTDKSNIGFLKRQFDLKVVIREQCSALY